jgi:hypothetical protein
MRHASAVNANDEQALAQELMLQQQRERKAAMEQVGGLLIDSIDSLGEVSGLQVQ